MAEELSLRERIFSGPLLYGPSLLSMSPTVVEIMALAGADFVWIEIEHSAIGMGQLEGMLRAAEMHDCLTLARIADGSRPWVLRTLESGAQIILVPQIHTPEQAAAVAEYGKFPPLGKRGYNTGSRGLRYGTLAPTPDGVFARANLQNVLMVQIESVQALHNLEAIADTPGIDGLFFGPGDMSADMGISAQWDHEDLLAAGESVIRAARARGLVSASTCPSLDMAARWKQAGVNMLVATGDVGLLRTGLMARLAEVKAL